MGRYNFLQHHLWFEIQKYFPEVIILFPVGLKFQSMHNIHTITSGESVQPDDPRIPQLQATHYECSKQDNLRQFSWTR